MDDQEPFTVGCISQAGQYILVVELRKILQKLGFRHAAGQTRQERLPTVSRVPRTQGLPKRTAE